MRHALIPAMALAVMLSAPAVPAQEAEPGTPEEGLSLIERGAQIFLRGLLSEAEPQLDELRNFAEELEPRMREFSERMGPAMAELLARIDDLSNYATPEILPNGDILIRRKPEAPPLDLPEGEIEL